MLGLILEFLFIHFFIVDVESLSHFRDCALISLLLGSAQGSGRFSQLNCGCDGLDGLRICAHARDILFDQVLLELGTRLAVVPSVINVEYQLAGTDSLNKLLEFSVVAVGTVRYFVVQGHISVVFVVPTGQNNKYCWLLLVALVHVVFFKFADVLDVDTSVSFFKVRREQLRRQI